MPTRHFNFADLFELAVDKVPDHRAARLAHTLADLGVKAGDHVGILATNCIEWVESLFAIYKIRASAVNINFRYVEDELRYLFENSDVVACVYQREYGPLVAAARSSQPPLQQLVRIQGNDSTAAEAALQLLECEASITAGSPDCDVPERPADKGHL